MAFGILYTLAYPQISVDYWAEGKCTFSFVCGYPLVLYLFHCISNVKTYPLSFFRQLLYSCHSCFQVGVFFSFVLPLLYYNAIWYFLFCSVVCSFTFLCVVVLTPAVLIGLVGIKYLILKYVRKSCHIAQCHCLNILHLLLSCVSTLCCILVLCAHSDLTY